MIDPTLLREQPDEVRARLAARGDDLRDDLNRIAALDSERRSILPLLESTRRTRKDIGEQIAKAKKVGQSADDLIRIGQEHGAAIKEHEAKLEVVEAERVDRALKLPNLPDPSVPVGGSEADNVEVRRHGEPTAFSFDPQPHWDLGPALYPRF